MREEVGLVIYVLLEWRLIANSPCADCDLPVLQGFPARQPRGHLFYGSPCVVLLMRVAEAASSQMRV